MSGVDILMNVFFWDFVINCSIRDMDFGCEVIGDEEMDWYCDIKCGGFFVEKVLVSILMNGEVN